MVWIFLTFFPSFCYISFNKQILHLPPCPAVLLGLLLPPSWNRWKIWNFDYVDREGPAIGKHTKPYFFSNFKTLCPYDSPSEMFSRLEPLGPSVHEVVPFGPGPRPFSQNPTYPRKRPLATKVVFFKCVATCHNPITQTQILWGKLRVSKKGGGIHFSCSSSRPPQNLLSPTPPYPHPSRQNKTWRMPSPI